MFGRIMKINTSIHLFLNGTPLLEPTLTFVFWNVFSFYSFFHILMVFTHSCKVPESHWQTNTKRCRSFHIGPLFVGHRFHTLARNLKVKPCPTVTLFSCKTWTTAAVRRVRLDCSGLFRISFKDCPLTLMTPRELLDLNPFMIALDASAPSQDVANTSEGADLAADQQAQSPCRVQVGLAHMPKSLTRCGYGQCKGQRDLQLLSNLRLDFVFIFSNDGSYANEYKQKHADILRSPSRTPSFLS